MGELISIIMPAYNCGDCIERTINNILNQTYENWELIIVDDCSADDTVLKIKKFNDERIRFFRNETNSGAAITRNKALREAKGKYIAFQDSDDLWEERKLEIQYKYMKRHNYKFTYTDYRIITPEGKKLPYECTGPAKVTKRKLYNYCYFSTITVMYDREAIGLIQIEDIRKNNDYAMWFQAVEKTDCYRLPMCLSYYCKRENSISSGSKINLIKYHYLLFRKALHKNVFLSIIFTINNLFHGVIKKIKYRRYVEV